jgi:hypothetical protein
MSSVTYKFDFFANSKLEIEETVKKKVSTYIDSESDNPLRYVSYETLVTDSTDTKHNYQVQVTARIRDDN